MVKKPTTPRRAITATDNSGQTTPFNDLRLQKLDKMRATVIPNIEKQYGDGTVFLGNMVIETEVVPTGSISLDLALGVGGLPRGRIIEIYGPESSGKTTLALHAVAQAQQKNGVCVFIDMEHALDPSWAKRIGVNIDELIITQPDYGEQALQVAQEFIQSGLVDLIVIDSVAALVPRAEFEGAIGDTSVGLQARMMSKAMRILVGSVKQTKTVVIFINQLREKVGTVGYGSPETTTGGRALKFYSSVRLDIRRIQTIKQAEVSVGSRTKVKVTKNKVAAPFQEAEFDIMFNEGISTTGEILDIGVDKGVVTKSGAFFRYGEGLLGQGKENAKKYLRENPSITFEIHNAVLASLNLPQLTNIPVYNRLELAEIGKAAQDPKINPETIYESPEVRVPDDGDEFD